MLILDNICYLKNGDKCELLFRRTDASARSIRNKFRRTKRRIFRRANGVRACPAGDGGARQLERLG